MFTIIVKPRDNDCPHRLGSFDPKAKPKVRKGVRLGKGGKPIGLLAQLTEEQRNKALKSDIDI